MSRADYLPECPASIRGICLASTQGDTSCDVDEGECIHAVPARLARSNGPTVREAAAADRAYWEQRDAGEGS